jgi:hypothetical protein
MGKCTTRRVFHNELWRIRNRGVCARNFHRYTLDLVCCEGVAHNSCFACVNVIKIMLIKKFDIDLFLTNRRVLLIML